jgi:hypothetical protein
MGSTVKHEVAIKMRDSVGVMENFIFSALSMGW